MHLFVMLSAAEWMTGCVESPSCRCLRHSCDNSDARRLESEIFFRLSRAVRGFLAFLSPTLAVESSLVFSSLSDHQHPILQSAGGAITKRTALTSDSDASGDASRLSSDPHALLFRLVIRP